VDGEPGRTPYTHETYYLETALRLRLPTEKTAVILYEPERLAWGDGAQLPDLAPFRVVVLCNVPGLAATDVSRLQKFVLRGGGLLVFGGGRLKPEGYEGLRAAGVLPARIVEEAGPDLYRFESWVKAHPILQPLSDPQQGDLRRVVFRQITRLKPEAGGKVLAKAPTGDPLLVEGRLENGTVLMVAAPADRDWGDWPQGRLYVPLVHQLVGYLTERLPETQRVQTAAVGPGATNPPGVTASGRIVQVRNLDPRESEIGRLSVEQFRQLFRLPQADSAAALAAVDPPPGSQRPNELWPYVVWLLFLVLALELFVANRSTA
jgi:hypothetical protein